MVKTMGIICAKSLVQGEFVNQMMSEKMPRSLYLIGKTPGAYVFKFSGLQT